MPVFDGAGRLAWDALGKGAELLGRGVESLASRFSMFGEEVVMPDGARILLSRSMVSSSTMFRSVENEFSGGTEEFELGPHSAEDANAPFLEDREIFKELCREMPVKERLY